MALRDTELVLTVPSRATQQFLGRYPFRQVKAPSEIPGFQYLMAWHPRLENEDLHNWFRNLFRRNSGKQYQVPKNVSPIDRTRRDSKILSKGEFQCRLRW